MSRESGSCGKKKKIEGKERLVASETSSSSMIKKSVKYGENSILRMRQDNLMINESDKENRAGKESTLANNNAAAAAAADNSVRQIKAIYQDKLIRRKNPQPTGTIKKRKKSNLDECEEESKNIITANNKRSNICGEEQQRNLFQKSRFKIYKDDWRKKCDDYNEIIGDNSLGKSSNIHHDKIDAIVVSDENTIKSALDDVIPSAAARVSSSISSVGQCGKTIQGRGVTSAVETFSLSPRPREKQLLSKVKALRAKILSSKSCDTHGSLYLQYDLPYDDNLIEYELAKEKSNLNISKQFFQRNITDKQRKIIVKFLTRLNCHLFHPSYYLYQTVKLFDAILDTTVIEIENLQLNALAAMWIVLKRECNVYKIPTAETIISFSKDLYEGKKDLLLKCEMKILQTLSFSIVFSDPFSILFYNIIKWKNSNTMETREISTAYYCGNYMIDLSLFDQDLIKISAVLLASAAAEIALYLTMVRGKDASSSPSSSSSPLWLNWRAPHTIQRYTERDIEPVRSTLIRKIFESSLRHNEADVVFKKYTRSRYGRISHFLGTKVRCSFYSE